MTTLHPKTRTEVWATFAEMRHELDSLERRVTEVELLAVTVQRASVMTSLRQRDIRDAIYDGALPALRVGRRLLILTPDLRRWLEGLSSRTPSGVPYDHHSHPHLVPRLVHRPRGRARR